jgi:hypothetical protein
MHLYTSNENRKRTTELPRVLLFIVANKSLSALRSVTWPINDIENFAEPSDSLIVAYRRTEGCQIRYTQLFLSPVKFCLLMS